MRDYSELLSARAQALKPSGIRKFFDMLGGMDDVISLTVGQPDFVTPWHIREAGIESLEQGKTYYTSNSGLEVMRNEITAYLSRRFGLEYDPSEIIVTVGGSEAIDIAMRAILNPGDEVKAGQILGKTGTTGMAVGDHVHFGVLVGGIPVTPIEWLDAKWVQSNITRRLNTAL